MLNYIFGTILKLIEPECIRQLKGVLIAKKCKDAMFVPVS